MKESVIAAVLGIGMVALLAVGLWWALAHRKSGNPWERGHGEWSVSNVTNQPPAFGPVVVIGGEMYDPGPQPRPYSMTNAPAKDLRGIPVALGERMREAMRTALQELRQPGVLVTTELLDATTAKQLRMIADAQERRVASAIELKCALSEWEAYMKTNVR